MTLDWEVITSGPEDTVHGVLLLPAGGAPASSYAAVMATSDPCRCPTSRSDAPGPCADVCVQRHAVQNLPQMSGARTRLHRPRAQGSTKVAIRQAERPAVTSTKGLERPGSPDLARACRAPQAEPTGRRRWQLPGRAGRPSQPVPSPPSAADHRRARTQQSRPRSTGSADGEEEARSVLPELVDRRSLRGSE